MTDSEIRKCAKQFNTENVWTTGMGKSAVPAILLARDLATLGVNANYIPGDELLHGGIGRCHNREGTFFFFSDSGQTDEIIQANWALRRNADVRAVMITEASLSAAWSDGIVYEPQSTTARGLPNAIHQQIHVARVIAESMAPVKDVSWAHPANREQPCTT